MMKYLLKNKKKKREFILCFFLSAICILSSAICFPVWADYRLSVAPVEEAESIRFGRVSFSDSVTKEVRVTITSDLTQQYQIRQKLLEPLVNSEEEKLDSEAIIFYTLRDSNVYGSLYSDTPYDLDSMESTLYTSSSEGLSDSFIVVYTVKGEELNISGNFLGRIRYSLVPLGEAGTEQEVILNFYLDAERKFEVKINTSYGEGQLKLVEEDGELSAVCEIEIKGRLGEGYSIYQQAYSEFKDKDDKTVSLGICKYNVFSQKEGAIFVNSLPLSLQRVLIYSSDSLAHGDKIEVAFSVSKEEKENLHAGRFNSKLLYIVESVKDGIIKEIPLTLELEIEEIFNIKVSSVDTGSRMFFPDLKPYQKIERELVIKVNSNLNNPYSVIQKFIEPLTNKEGNQIPLEAFSVKGVKLETEQGKVVFSDFVNVDKEEMGIFVSDNKGSSTEFKVKYLLICPPDMKGGNYSTQIEFSLVAK